MFEYLKLLYFLIKPKTIFLRRISDGMGDNLLLSILLQPLRQKYPGHTIVVETPWTELFINNPFLDWATAKHIKTTRRHIKPKYRVDPATKSSIYSQILSHINSQENYYPQIYLSAEELAFTQSNYPQVYIAICPQGKTTHFANRKEWGFENFQKLRNLLALHPFVQIGRESDKLLDNVIDGRGLPIRKSASILQRARFFIGLEGGLMHLAKAVGTKAVIIYGGAVRPEISHYEDQIIFYNPVPCSPCYYSSKRHDDCDHMTCMKQISPERVFREIQQQIFKEAKVRSEDEN